MLAFISYAQENFEEAKKTKECLEDMQLRTFLAKEHIKAGQEWKKEIFDNLKSMDLFVCILSENYNNSIYCLQEAAVALFKKEQDPSFFILPLSLDDTPPKGFMSFIQSQPLSFENFKNFFKPDCSQKMIDFYVKKLFHFTDPNNGYNQTRNIFKEIKYFSKNNKLNNLSSTQVFSILRAAAKNRQVFEVLGQHKNEYEYKQILSKAKNTAFIESGVKNLNDEELTEAYQDFLENIEGYDGMRAEKKPPVVLIFQDILTILQTELNERGVTPPFAQ